MQATTRIGTVKELRTDDVETLRGRIHGAVLTESSLGYEEARRVWNGMIDRTPAVIVRCAGVSDVMSAVDFARRHDLLLAVRGGGHNVAGTAACDGGLVCDLTDMRDVKLDLQRGTVCAQGGATWADVDRVTQPHGLATPGGVVSSTGIAGLTLSGGYSSQRRAHGMTIDNLVSAEVVTADGRLLRASEDEHPDLFWALRGGGGNFGVVTRFEYRLHELGPDVMSLNVAYPIEQTRQLLGRYVAAVTGAPDELTTEFLVWNLPDTSELPEPLRAHPFCGVGGMWAGRVEDGAAAVAPLREFDSPLVDMSRPVSYLELQQELDPLVPDGLQCYWKSLYLDAITDEIADMIAEWALLRPSSLTIVVLRHLGGAISRVPADATAFHARAPEWMLSIDSMWVDPAEASQNIEYTRRFWDELQRFSGGRTYFNFASELLDDEALRTSYGPNYERLVAVKTRYDPGNLFRVNQNITPLRSSAGA